MSLLTQGTENCHGCYRIWVVFSFLNHCGLHQWSHCDLECSDRVFKPFKIPNTLWKIFYTDRFFVFHIKKIYLFQSLTQWFEMSVIDYGSNVVLSLPLTFKAFVVFIMTRIEYQKNYNSIPNKIWKKVIQFCDRCVSQWQKFWVDHL